MRTLVGILSICTVVLYATGYWICEYFYLEDVDKWRELRDLLTGIVIFSLVLINFMPRTDLSKAALWAFGVLCFGNIVDRFLFDTIIFVWSDYFLIITAISVFIFKIYHAKNIRRSNAIVHKNDTSGISGR